MTRVLMVCLGNICRSPLAEGILKAMVDSEQVFVDSAGTAGYHVGHAPDTRSIKVAQKYGIDISRQRCRKFTPEDFQKFDTIYAMDRSNYSNIIAQAPTQDDRKKVKLLLQEAPNQLEEVPDPYYGGEDGFEYVFTLVKEACENIAKKLQDE